MLNAVAVGLAHPDPAAVVAGRDADPVGSAVVNAFGGWSDKPFAAVVLVAFIACGMAAQALTARVMFSVARDGALPASRALRTVDRRGAPIGATVATALIACGGLLFGLHSAAVGSLIAFGTAAIYVAFLLIAARGADRARARDVGSARAHPPGPARRAPRSTRSPWSGWRSRP